MGGNVIINGIPADRIFLNQHNRKKFANKLLNFIANLNIFSNFFSQQALESLNVFSGSARHFFDLNNISDTEFLGVKDSVGDIDLMVDENEKVRINTILANMTETTEFFIGMKLSGDQTITLWRIPEIGNVQIDFEFVKYENGMPSAWSQFAHSSPWPDMKEGIKGVAHKYILRALATPHLIDCFMVSKTGKRTRTKAAPMTFSPLGMRWKLRKLNRKHEGIDCFMEMSPKETGFITDFREIFEAYFGPPRDMGDVELLHSFVGINFLCKKYLCAEDRQEVFDGFVRLIVGPRAQKFYRNDPARDFSEKMTMAIYMKSHDFSLDYGSWLKMSAEYFNKGEV